MNTEEKDRAKNQARAQLDSIIEMVTALDTEDDEAREEAMQTIQDDPLSVQVRSGWCDPGEENLVPQEFEILLCTGGPACRILGELDEHREPDRARLEYQDWGTPWTPVFMTADESEAVLRYCQQFYFGN